MEPSAEAFFLPSRSGAPTARSRPPGISHESSNALRKVYIVDDERTTRQTLHFMITGLGYRVRPFLSGVDFLEEIDSLRPGCVLLDLWMPGLGGLEVLQRMQRRFDVLPVIVLTGHADVATAVDALKLGASDLLEKPPNTVQLQRAIQRAFETIDREHASNIAIAKNARLISSLSTREREVLEGLGSGLSNKAIAAELGLSVRTIEMHRARMMDRLGLKTVADVVALAITMGIAGAQPS